MICVFIYGRYITLPDSGCTFVFLYVIHFFKNCDEFENKFHDNLRKSHTDSFQYPSILIDLVSLTLNTQLENVTVIAQLLGHGHCTCCLHVRLNVCPLVQPWLTSGILV